MKFIREWYREWKYQRWVRAWKAGKARRGVAG